MYRQSAKTSKDRRLLDSRTLRIPDLLQGDQVVPAEDEDAGQHGHHVGLRGFGLAERLEVEAGQGEGLGGGILDAGGFWLDDGLLAGDQKKGKDQDD